MMLCTSGTSKEVSDEIHAANAAASVRVCELAQNCKRERGRARYASRDRRCDAKAHVIVCLNCNCMVVVQSMYHDSKHDFSTLAVPVVRTTPGYGHRWTVLCLLTVSQTVGPAKERDYPSKARPAAALFVGRPYHQRIPEQHCSLDDLTTTAYNWREMTDSVCVRTTTSIATRAPIRAPIFSACLQQAAVTCGSIAWQAGGPHPTVRLHGQG